MDSAQKQMSGDNPKSWTPVENTGSLGAGCKHQVRMLRCRLKTPDHWMLVANTRFRYPQVILECTGSIDAGFELQVLVESQCTLCMELEGTKLIPL